MSAFTSLSLGAISMFLLSVVVVSASAGYGYGLKPKADYPTHKSFPGIIGIQGLIYCKSGPKAKLIPLKSVGAVARITCLAAGPNGYESAPFSVLSSPADAKGYFLATLSPYSQLKDGWKLRECKAFLEKSPMESCKVPTNVNNGMSGALLKSSKLLENMKLYSLDPFFFTSPTKSTPSNGY